jgi:hypothetical protein
MSPRDIGLVFRTFNAGAPDFRDEAARHDP